MENIQDKIENSIIDCINLGVMGRLVIFKPEKNNFGADLAVERRAKYKEKEVYFQINSFVAPAKAKNFVKDFPQENFKTDKNFYLLFVYFDEVGQKISDYIWLIPSVQFKDIAEVMKSPGSESFLRFEAPLDIQQKNKYSKFIVNKKELGVTILNALEKGGKFVFKGFIFGEKGKINLENLKEFLSNARKDTYAANADPVGNPRLLTSTQYEFQKGNYFYRDIFFNGDGKFIGQEIVYYDADPIWGMNYMGNTIGKLETNFLKEALLKLNEICRLGGVCEYEKREFKYQDQGQGNLEEFYGSEEIFSEGKKIYKLTYQGGLI